MRQDFGSLAASAGSVPAGMSHLASSVKTPKAVEIGMRGGVLEVPSAAPVICLWAFILAYIWTNRMGFFIRPTGPCQSIPVTSFPASSSNFPGTLPIHTVRRTYAAPASGEVADSNWEHEVKFDGYRALGIKSGGHVADISEQE
jgi:hypothetical protein